MPAMLDMLDSDMETNPFIDENSLISSVSDDTSIAQVKAAKKPRKRKPVTMPKRVRAKPAECAEPNEPVKTAGAKRKVMEADIKEDEGQDERELVETEPLKTKARPTKVNVPRVAEDAALKRGRSKASKKAPMRDVDVEEAIPSPVAVRSNFAQTKTVNALPKPATERKLKPTSKRPAKAVSKALDEIVSDFENEDDQDAAQQQPPKKRMRTEVHARHEPTYRRRAGSASDTERGDPMLRRKLGDITRKYENMEVRFRNLKDVGVAEANRNVEKIRRQCEAITDASNTLVSSLKKELAQQAPMVQESRKLKKEAQTAEIETAKLRTANNELSATLAAAQTEIKSLQAKLATARAIPAPLAAKPPPTTTKVVVPARQVVTTNQQLDKEAQLKLDLYGDLTGLIIRSVKQADDGETYDCIQTGRNGTLHFKLFVDQENSKKVSFEETEFLYTPLLDTNRDRDLMEMMPDYLTEDITFVREVAAKFYARVVKTLTEKPVEEED